MRRRGQILQQTSLANAVGVLLAGDLAPRLLDNFDFYELALASCVSRRWRTAAVRLAPYREKDFLTKSGAPSEVASVARALNQFNQFAAHSLDEEFNRVAAGGFAEDLVADRLVRSYRQGFCAHVVGAGTAGVPSYVEFLEHITPHVVPGRVLIVAVQDELDKWNEAFQGKAYFCGDLDAAPLRADGSDEPDSGLLVSVCSEDCVRRHFESVASRSWDILVIDAGVDRASAMCMSPFGTEPRLLTINANAYHVFSRPLPRTGLDVAEAAFRVRLLLKPFFDHGNLDEQHFQLWRATDIRMPEGRCLRELIRRNFSARLISDATTVRVVAQP